MGLRLKAPKPVPVYVPGLDKGKRREPRKVARRRIIRPIGPGELHPDSRLSDATLAMIERGEIQFRWDQVADTPRPNKQQRARQARQDRERMRRRELAQRALTCVVPWVPLITPITPAELERLRILKRERRRQR